MYSYKFLNELFERVDGCFYIFDENGFADKLKRIKQILSKCYENVEIAYAYKSNHFLGMCKIINDNNGYAEICSKLEYELALSVGVLHNRMILNGPSKDKRIMADILLNGGIVNVDSYAEFEKICDISKENPKNNLRIGIRCNADTTDGRNSRFGLDVYCEETSKLLKHIKNSPNIELSQIHCHIKGRTIESWTRKARFMMDVYNFLVEEFNIVPESINLGGGLPVCIKNNVDEAYEEFANNVLMLFKSSFTQRKNPKIFFEPGAAISSEHMMFVTKIKEIKEVHGRSYATLDGDRFCVNPLNKKYAMDILVFNEGTSGYYKKIDFVGTTCMEDDVLYEYDGHVCEGSIVVFKNVGAYSITLKPSFINLSPPIVCFDEKKDFKVIKRREQISDILAQFN